MLRKCLAATVAVLVALAVAQPAEASPGTVTKVQIVAASTTSLTLDWPAVSGSSRYDVFYATSYDKVLSSGIRKKTGSASKYTVKGLRPGHLYCFMVRSVRGSSVGRRSQRTCKPTIPVEGATSGLKIRVVTYNTCSRVCGKSSTKVKRGKKLLTDPDPQPDIIALQEANNYTTAPTGYAFAIQYDGDSKSLMYKKETFRKADAGPISLGHDNWAVWAELVDIKTDRHIIAVSAHLQNGKTATAASQRRSETGKLIAGANKVPGDHPIIFAGDFNSNKNRGKYDTVAAVMNNAGYWDAFDLAQTLKSPNWNSSLLNGKLKYAVKWGDHVDHIWVKKDVGVTKWSKLGQNQPRASDHFPVGVDLVIP